MIAFKQLVFTTIIPFLLLKCTYAHVKSPIISIADAFTQNKIKLEIKSKGEYNVMVFEDQSRLIHKKSFTL